MWMKQCCRVPCICLPHHLLLLAGSSERTFHAVCLNNRVRQVGISGIMESSSDVRGQKTPQRSRATCFPGLIYSAFRRTGPVPLSTAWTCLKHDGGTGGDRLNGDAPLWPNEAAALPCVQILVVLQPCCRKPAPQIGPGLEGVDGGRGWPRWLRAAASMAGTVGRRRWRSYFCRGNGN